MNREDTKQAIEVMQAYVDGAEIEAQFLDNGNWVKETKDLGPTWNFGACSYRIKPKPREFWICTTKGSHRHYYNCVDHKPVNTNYIKVREIIE